MSLQKSAISSEESRLVQPLPDGAVDIVGDVHGEFACLTALLQHLGYDENGRHPEERTLVFLGDLVDRGLDSPGVVSRVRRMVECGNAVCTLGNHELNLLRGERKHGNGWFFAEPERIDVGPECFQSRFLENDSERAEMLEFFARLPLVLERDDLRVVHAAWSNDAVSAARISRRAEFFKLASAGPLAHDPRQARLASLAQRLRDRTLGPPAFDAELAAYLLEEQALEPVSVLLSGPERVVESKRPFFAGGRYRFVERLPWWESYDGVPVVVGHYWRRRTHRAGRGAIPQGAPNTWWGRGRVYCVDYSVGVRGVARAGLKSPPYRGHLAALRFPELQLVFETGERCQVDPPTARGS